MTALRVLRRSKVRRRYRIAGPKRLRVLARRRPCPGPWTGFMSVFSPLCACHAVPAGWEDEAYPFRPEAGLRCTLAGCPCVAP